MDGLTFPGGLTTARTTSAGASRPSTRRPARSTDLYTECDGRPAAGARTTWCSTPTAASTSPTTASSTTRSGSHQIAGIYYAQADGSGIKEVVFPSDDPNGIGLSPDGTKLYWAETWRGRILQRDIIAPGEVVEPGLVDTSQCLYGFPGFQLLDSLAVDSRRQRVRRDDRQRRRLGRLARRASSSTSSRPAT